MTGKTLFDAAEAEARTMGNALNKLGAFMRMAQKAVNQFAEETGREAPLSLDGNGGLTMKKHVFGMKEGRPALSDRMSERLFSAVHQAVGSASVCWSNVDGAGDYNAVQAGLIAFELCHTIADEIDAERDAACGYNESTTTQRKPRGRNELYG